MNPMTTSGSVPTPQDFEPSQQAVLRILLAEDDTALNRALSLRLAAAGFDVTSTDEGQSALELADTLAFDVVLLDLALPLLPGLSLLRRLRSPEHSGGPHVVVLTGAEDELAAHAECQGAFAVLRKPAPFDVLVRILRAAAARRVAA